MKQIFTIILTIAVISQAIQRDEPEDCKCCKEGVTQMFKHFLEFQVELGVEGMIIHQVCSHESNPDECTMLVKQYWKVLAPRVFNQYSAAMACDGLNPDCPVAPGYSTSIKTVEYKGSFHRQGDTNWKCFEPGHEESCETCRADLEVFGKLLVSDDAADAAVTMIQGKAFCKDPEIGLSGDDIEQCQDYVANYIPKVMKHMFNGMGDHAEYICHHEWEVCHHPNEIKYEKM